jgi:hypothetical protein
MPCDSVAAGLIALGTLIRDLGRKTATNVDDHYDAMLRYARQYIECCRDCDVRCHPKQRRCGYTSEATGLLRYKGRKLLRILDKTKVADQDVLVLSREGGTWTVFKKGDLKKALSTSRLKGNRLRD